MYKLIRRLLIHESDGYKVALKPLQCASCPVTGSSTLITVNSLVAQAARIVLSVFGEQKITSIFTRRKAWVQALPSVIWDLCLIRDLRFVPNASRPREQVENHGRACTQVLFQRKAKLEFFHFLEIVTGWLVPSAGQKIPVQPSWYLPPQKTPLAEYGFLQAGKGSWKYKGKFQAVLYSLVMPLEWLSSRSKHTSTLPPWASAYFWNALLLGHYPIPTHQTHSNNPRK
jgi:hypothetical protein